MLYMIIETFRDGDAAPIYRRLSEQGRSLPAELTYVASWVTADLKRCFQVMECDDRALLDEWATQWTDLVDFEILPVVTSSEAAEVIAPRL